MGGRSFPVSPRSSLLDVVTSVRDGAGRSTHVVFVSTSKSSLTRAGVKWRSCLWGSSRVTTVPGRRPTVLTGRTGFSSHHVSRRSS